ncbi:hypothetical protein YC2023_107359 [Brassica napus]|uniref:(rape) hypothetical protein n=1 Tax=Brassica napus TaxID=3708 RepID=A0A816NZ10_BRANA|nr:unnamed protein product [Brassica napus]
MAQPYVYAHPPGTAPRPSGAFVNPRFCVAGPVDLTMVRDETEKKWGSFYILDANMNLRFQVKKPGFGFGFGRNMILLDGSGSPILTMKEQTMTMSFREKWEVHIGDQAAYTVKGSSIFSSSTKLDGLHVFLARNHEEEIPDFRVKATNHRGFERSCVVYAGESDTIVAQMQHEQMQHEDVTASNTDIFTVTINPNVDHAFIASLVIILDVYNRVDTELPHRYHEAHQAVNRVHMGLHGATHAALRAGACTIQ